MIKLEEKRAGRGIGRRRGLKTRRGQAGVSSPSFADRVCEVVRRIPIGQTCSYQQVAAAAGSPRAYRAVGNILRQNFDPGVPCHRVIRSNGALGGYNRGWAVKKKLLAREAKIKKSVYEM